MALISKKEAIVRQIHGAIEHLYKGEFECAITLAGAAEGQSAYQHDEVLFAQLKIRVPPEFKNEKEWRDWLNAVRDWLKHPTPQWGDELNVAEYDAVTMTLRALSKFQYEHRQSTPRIEEFLDWCREHGYPSRPAKH
jgi:hypothetical protein